MIETLRQKFAPGTRRATLLLGTGNANIEERTKERTWGTGSEDKGGNGLIITGQCLMRRRTELQSNRDDESDEPATREHASTLGGPPR